jgi:hypothetical protein
MISRIILPGNQGKQIILIFLTESCYLVYRVISF